jgi:hypothetical protein
MSRGSRRTRRCCSDKRRRRFCKCRRSRTPWQMHLAAEVGIELPKCGPRGKMAYGLFSKRAGLALAGRRTYPCTSTSGFHSARAQRRVSRFDSLVIYASKCRDLQLSTAEREQERTGSAISIDLTLDLQPRNRRCGPLQNVFHLLP